MSHVFYRDQVAVLMYHHVHATDEGGITITPQLFKDQISHLQKLGYHFIRLHQFKQYLNGSPVPHNAVLLTFDDGYESVYENVYPFLKQQHIPMVNFIMTETLPQVPHLPPTMTTQQLSIMSKETDLVENQSHTDALHHKTNNDDPDGDAYFTSKLPTSNGTIETDEQYHTRIVEDAKRSRQQLHPVNKHAVDVVAYPFGIYTDTAIQYYQEGGFNYGFTIVEAMATRHADSMKIPRINAGSPWIAPSDLHGIIQSKIVS
ncbi:polysaccharide deacetylase family protein [Paenibacillus oleatilyticus]|uniref:polysaccharide deacetylase family protein n=1 Tax=Paenibacillus oleatilyticus TaxID=2594886 RepID=UPI001C1F3FA5|nr:polysaccharide deacetylase family protein [Paenibacillus oleatilyticus]MBU7320513.1 polysaccharide deacetylase family protein [Paenibacillus oleatilyticus]